MLNDKYVKINNEIVPLMEENTLILKSSKSAVAVAEGCTCPPPTNFFFVNDWLFRLYR